jgi:hypothetical protein
MSRDPRRNKGPKPQVEVKVDDHVMTREEIEAKVKEIPEKDLYIVDEEKPNLGFIPNPDLNPNNPEDREAIDAEAREFYEKYKKPQDDLDLVESTDKFKEVIRSEQDFLNHFKNEEKQVQIVHDGALITFNVRPLQPGDDFSNLNVDSDVFTDMDTATRNAVMKRSKGIELTSRETGLIDKIDSGTNAEMAKASLSMAHSILSQFVTPPTYDDIEVTVKDPETQLEVTRPLQEDEKVAKRLEFWETQPFTFKIFLSNEVSHCLGLNTETRFKLFRPSGND